MGYRTYLSLKQYASKEEREEVRNKFFSEITDYCEREDIDYLYFHYIDWMRKSVCFDKEIQVGDTNLVDAFIRKNKSFIPDDVVNSVNNKFKKQVLDKNADDDPDGLRLVSLSKDDVVEMIRDCYLAIAKNYKQKLEWAKDADLCMFFLQPRIESSIRGWETGAEKCVKLNADGKMDLPYPLDDTFEYEIMVLLETINNYAWECIDVVLYGY